MVLQIAAYAGQVDHRRDAVLLQKRGRANARQLQNLRRANAAGAQHDFTPGMRRHHLMAVPHLYPLAPLAAVGQGFEDQAADLRRGPQLEIRAGVAGRAQKSLGRVPAPALALVHFEIANALVVAAVEVIGGRDAGLLRRL